MKFLIVQVQVTFDLRPLPKQFMRVQLGDEPKTVIRAIARAKVLGLVMPESRYQEVFILRKTNHSLMTVHGTTTLLEDDTIVVMDQHDDFHVKIIVQENNKPLGVGHDKEVHVFPNTKIIVLFYEANRIMPHFEAWEHVRIMAPIGPGGKYVPVSSSLFVTKEMRIIIVIPHGVKVKQG